MVAGCWAIPLGRLEPVAGTPFDLTAPAAIGDRTRRNHPQVLRVAGIDHASTRPADASSR